MGRAASEYADKIVVTNDNPRSELPELIAQEIVAGVANDVQIELDRKQAILSSINSASSNDWVLIAGKGHETTQQIGERISPFSDRELVAQLVTD